MPDHDRPQPPHTPDESPAPKGGGRERRRWPRAEADWAISLALPDGDYVARVRDVSRAGVCFFIDRPIPVMTAMRIDLELPVEEGKRFITGGGVVVRCEKISARLDHYEIALFLNDIAEPDQAALEAYVSGPSGGGHPRARSTTAD
ncbi:MAG: PilZ domain-containing protein [Planctomycetes bacterium]|nr:PilZ domain-containing protein [Planctomycetota bacterium]MCB9904305.1 PilZ domain-containing protein [Planctomycetota bacterium]